MEAIMPNLRDILTGRYSPFAHSGKAGEVRQTTIEDDKKKKAK